MRRWIPLVALLLLAGCNESAETPTPSRGCTKTGNSYSCGRGGTCWQCFEYGITCPVPTKLAQGDGKLICKLGDE